MNTEEMKNMLEHFIFQARHGEQRSELAKKKVEELKQALKERESSEPLPMYGYLSR